MPAGLLVAGAELWGGLAESLGVTVTVTVGEPVPVPDGPVLGVTDRDGDGLAFFEVPPPMLTRSRACRSPWRTAAGGG